MARGLTPIIGLAVVVALALAAVFGAMSLANPAMAAIGQPADGELIERMDSPQAVPADVKAEGGDGTITLTWTRASTDVRYRVRYTDGVTYTFAGLAAGQNYGADCDSGTDYDCSLEIQNLTNGTEHTVEVQSALADGGFSAYAAAKAIPSGMPNAPVVVTAAKGVRSVSLTWVPGAPAPRGPITKWQYTTDVTGGSVNTSPAAVWKDISGGASASGHMIGDLPSGMGVMVAVRAVSHGTAGDPAYTTPATVTPDPSAPRDLKATASDKTVVLTWKGPSPADPGVVGYEYRQKKGDGSFGAWTALNGTEADTSVTPNVPAVTAAAVNMVERGTLENGVVYAFEVRTVAGEIGDPGVDLSTATSTITSAAAEAMATPMMPTASTLMDDGIDDPDLLGIGGRIAIDLSSYYNIGIGAGAIDSYHVEAVGGSVAVTGLDDMGMTDDGMIAIIGLSEGVSVVTVTATDGNDEDDLDDPEVAVFTVTVGTAPPPVEEIEVPKNLPSFSPSSTSPGGSANYTVVFQIAKDTSVNTRQNDLVIEFHEDYSVAETIRNTSVAITTSGGFYPVPGGGMARTRTFTPEDVTVDGSEVLISLGDMDEQDDRFDYLVESEEVVTVHFRQSAGIKNPTEAGDFGGVVAIAFGGAVDVNNEDEDIESLGTTVPHTISIDPEDGGLGEMVTVKAKGFKNGTSLTVFRDMAEDSSGVFSEKLADQKLTSADDVLCTDPVVEDNIGTCTFEVTHPTFSAGVTNVINAVDGVNATAAQNKTKNFELKASILASPSGGSPGEMILVQVVDFEGSNITKVTIGGETYCDDSAPNRLGDSLPCGGGVDSQGSGSFSIEIPNWARGGLQELKVWSNGGTSASTKISLVGPQIRLTRESVVANQRISLIGTGFSPRSVIANVEDLPDSHSAPMISIGGETIDEERINDGDPVRVDNGGNWSASVDLPLSEATTAAGNREIRVRDSLARIGVVNVIVVDRTVTVTPEEGRVGTISVVRGEGFPSKNDEGSNFTVEIEYEAANGNAITVSALTDASGRFEQQLRVPTTAAIPSSNQIHVRFRDDDEVVVSITVPHEVPEGIIQPSETSGGPGSRITVSGEGFKSFVPVSLVKIGTLDVTPAPKPSTDGNGMMSFDITIPGLDVGIQTIEVNVGRTTASVGFTVTESGINPGDIKPVAEGLEDLGENLDVIWHFNNDTKDWTFYDGEEGSTLTHVITGETYLLLVKATTEVILNRDTRNLTCANGNCWNQIVW